MLAAAADVPAGGTRTTTPIAASLAAGAAMAIGTSMAMYSAATVNERQFWR